MTLFGSDPSPKDEKYAKAWSDLYNESAAIEDRCHAKTWLTYRAIDREILPEDYRSKVYPIILDPPSPRWNVAMGAAATYHGCLIEGQPQMSRINRLLGIRPDNESITSILRMHAIASYNAWLDADIDYVHGCFSEAMMKWRRCVAEYDPFSNLSRLQEMVNDPPVLTFMRLLVERSISGKFETKQCIIDALLKSQKHLSWWRCIEQMGRKERYLW